MGRDRHTFEVEGVGEFPYDMLRFDECWPYGLEASGALASESRDRRRIILQTDSLASPHDKRWASFNWRVVPDEAA